MFFIYLNHTTFTQCGKKSKTHISVDFVSIEKRAPKKVKIKKNTAHLKNSSVLTFKKEERSKSLSGEKKNVIKSKPRQTPLHKQVKIKNIYKEIIGKSLLNRKMRVSKSIKRKTVKRLKTLQKTQSGVLKEKKVIAAAKNHTKYVKSSQTSDKLSKKRVNKIRVVNISNRNYANIFMWINKHKFYPTEALYKEDEGKIELSFTINSNGKIVNINMQSPSQYDILNVAAIAIVKNSSPIPKRLLNSINSFPLKAQINIVFKIE